MQSLEEQREESSDFQNPHERPTIPAPPPCQSEVRLTVRRIAWPAATVDVVVCDLSRDPRSETFMPRARPTLMGKVIPLVIPLVSRARRRRK